MRLVTVLQTAADRLIVSQGGWLRIPLSCGLPASQFVGSMTADKGSHGIWRELILGFVPMKTVLDDLYTAFLHAAVYFEGDLRIIVAEGLRAAEPEDITIGGHLITGTYAVNTSEDSRLVEVCFSRPIAWQLVDESFTAGNEYEVREDNFALQVLTQSRYLDFVRANHGWFEEMGRGPGKHYRVWTENEVIDVVACEAPTVEPYEALRTNG